MGSHNSRTFNIFLITVGIVSFLILITIILIPLFLKKCCRKRKVSNTDSTEDVEGLLKEYDESIPCNDDIQETSNICGDSTEIECCLEYRTRGTQLIINVSNVVPGSICWRYVKESKNSKIFLLVYLNGESLNSPCQSTKHAMKSSIQFNEIFIFTVMPYDISSLHLTVQAVLVCGNWNYDIGHAKVFLAELDQSSQQINKSLRLPTNEDRSLVNECIFSLSLMKCKNAIKLKLVKLYFLETLTENKPITGLHVRTQLTDFLNPLQTFDTTKKKYSQCVTYNEVTMFTFDQPLNNSLELEIQILESHNLGQEETTSVCGRTVLYFNMDEAAAEGIVSGKHDDHLTEVINNPDVEVVRWHPIPYAWSSLR